MADESRPYIGYRSAGRRPESQQDRRASADAPLAALRGMVSGVLGAPGDIESLVRMLPGLSERTVLPTSEDIERRLPLRGVSETPIGRVATGMGTLGGGFYTGPGSPLRAIAGLPSAVTRAAGDFAMAAGQPAVNVVKPKGGNWLAGSVERAIEPMQQRLGREDEMLNMLRLANPDLNLEQARQVVRANLDPTGSDLAVNKWLESKLSKYIRNEMATPEDPLRALAERGVTHIPEGVEGLERSGSWVPENLGPRRKAAGFPEEGLATTPAGQGWELIADEAIHNMPARMRVSPDTGGGSTKALQVEQENPWLLKVPPDTMTYGAYPVEVRQELGFEHLVDELKNAINPASGLPENLRWKYSDLEKVTVPQAVERVAKINEWRAAQKAEADAARAMNPATHVVKEYPDQGFKWVELKAPKDDVMTRGEYADPTFDIPEAAQERIQNQAEREVRRLGLDDESDDYMYAIQDRVQELSQEYAAKNKPLVSKALEDALKYEGETMGHCVGGYCPDVIEGRSRIYSLRDKKGQPHVTIEVKPGVENPSITEGEFKGQRRFIVNNKGTGFPTIEEAQKYAQEISTPEIVQIKGKANRAPKEEYLPAVQDFIRSGNWGRIGDLQNTGLKPISSVPERQMFEGAGMKLPEYLTQTEHDALIDEFNKLTKPAFDPEFFNREFGGGTGLTPGARGEGFSQGGQVRGYANGGLVANFPTGDFDPDRIDAIVGKLHALNAG